MIYKSYYQKAGNMIYKFFFSSSLKVIIVPLTNIQPSFLPLAVHASQDQMLRENEIAYLFLPNLL